MCTTSGKLALKLAREAADLSMRINVSIENGLPTWDLHELTEATACILLADALLSLVALDATKTSLIDTGKGSKDTSTGSALRVKVPAFLNDVAGLETTAIEGNDGKFLITAASLEKWVASGASFQEVPISVSVALR